MGYTHYFTLKKTPPKEVWDQVLEAKNEIVRFAEVGYGVDVIDNSREDVIDINGVAPYDHENLLLSPKYLEFEFCKTAMKPYDIVVTAILCVLGDLLEDNIDISSDGGAKDWEPGQRLATEALGVQINIPRGVQHG